MQAPRGPQEGYRCDKEAVYKRGYLHFKVLLGPRGPHIFIWGLNT